MNIYNSSFKISAASLVVPGGTVVSIKIKTFDLAFSPITLIADLKEDKSTS